MPISESDNYTRTHWEEVEVIIKEALEDTDFIPKRVNEFEPIGIIMKDIVQNLHDSEMVICDVSSQNPNVMFELGMRLTFDKPVVLIKDSNTNFTFDIASIKHLDYPITLHHRKIQDFQEKLKRAVQETYEEFSAKRLEALILSRVQSTRPVETPTTLGPRTIRKRQRDVATVIR